MCVHECTCFSPETGFLIQLPSSFDVPNPSPILGCNSIHGKASFLCQLLESNSGLDSCYCQLSLICCLCHYQLGLKSILDPILTIPQTQTFLGTRVPKHSVWNQSFSLLGFDQSSLVLHNCHNCCQGQQSLREQPDDLTPFLARDTNFALDLVCAFKPRFR